jgi:hypothetical protein
MGNTKYTAPKYIAFAGDIYRGEEDCFSEQALLVVAHGDHVGVKTLHCYLHLDGEVEDNTDAEVPYVPYVIGHLTTRSMSGVIDHIVLHMKDGHIQHTDVDWTDIFLLTVKNRRITGRIELPEIPGTANEQPPGPQDLAGGNEKA